MPLVMSAIPAPGSQDTATPDGGRQREWPPDPARMVSALAVVAHGDDDRAALRWLESQPPPVIHTGAAAAVRLAWPTDADPATARTLDAMARRLPCLEQPAGIALAVAAVTAQDAAAVDGQEPGADTGGSFETAWEPCELLRAETSVRVPYPGFLDELDAQVPAARPPSEASRYCGYRRRTGRQLTPRPADRVVTTNRTVPSVYPDVVVFGFSGLRPPGTSVVQYADAMRSAVLRRAGTDAPEVLHGHRADGQPHVAFLALPDAGRSPSDGSLLGLAVAVPELPDDQRRAVLRAVLGLRRRNQDGIVDLTVPQIGQVELVYQPGLVRPWSADPERWRQGSDRWVSVTPVVLDHFPKRRVADPIKAEVLNCLRRVGLPDPIDLTVSTEPLLPGAIRLRPGDLPDTARGKQFRHIAVTFDRRVNGPVLVGAGRYLGVGLLAPVSK